MHYINGMASRTDLAQFLFVHGIVGETTTPRKTTHGTIQHEEQVMKRLLMLAALVGGLTFAGSTSTAEANGGYGGGRGPYHGGGWGGGNHGGYGGNRAHGSGYRPGIHISTPSFGFGYGGYGGYGGGYYGGGYGGYGCRGGNGW
jgi:hypothetical protein